jgi:hypothetical protein
MDLPAIDPRRASVAIVDSGGSGALTNGQILLSAIARTGLYGRLSRSAGPQIRGGESAAMLRFADRPVGCLGTASISWWDSTGTRSSASSTRSPWTIAP